MNILIFIIILLVLVLVHELGHFFTAKKFGIRVDEFGFGFPPKIFGIKKGETEYTINALPFGGFVKIFGENPDEAEKENLVLGAPLSTPSTKLDLSRSFSHKPKWQQAIVLFAGIFSNFLLAWLLFSFGFMSGLPTSVGSEPLGYIPTDIHLTVISVLDKSPAQISGLKSGDKIISLQSEKNNLTIINPDTLKSFIISHSNKEIKLGYIRGKNQDIIYTNLKPELSKTDNKPMIGISMDLIGTVRLPLFRALYEGFILTSSVTKDTVIGLYDLIKASLIGKGSIDSVTGPIGMVSIVGDAYKFGFTYLLSFAALISINLAIINLIPFPALDGGRLFFLLIEKIKGSRISPKVTNYANMLGFGILIFLMLFVTYNDVIKLF